MQESDVTKCFNSFTLAVLRRDCEKEKTESGVSVNVIIQARVDIWITEVTVEVVTDDTILGM